MSKITQIIAREILDSRGHPTIEAQVYTGDRQIGFACVPSGASTGKREALELRDGDNNRYLGKGVLKAVANVNGPIAKMLQGIDVFQQRKIDEIMMREDGTENKANLGANAILAVSLACARAGALDAKRPLFKYLKQDLKIPSDSGGGYCLPNPLMNIINGGAHASNNLDIQEFMIIPHMQKPFSENFRAGVEVFHYLKKVLVEHGHSTNVGDEGGFAPNLKSHEQAMDCIIKAIDLAGYRPGVDISLALDVAASEFFVEKTGEYKMQGKKFTRQQMIEYYLFLKQKYPIYSIEDGMAEDDYDGWIAWMQAMGKSTVLVGDDLFVTNQKILKEGIKKNWANAILIKVNQIGTLSETFDTLDMAFKNKMKVIISHRSGETGDHFIADLAVACACSHIKTGSCSRSDRIEKYNQLLKIEQLLKDRAFYRPMVK